MAMPRLAGGTCVDRLAVDQHIAGGRVLQAGDDAQQRGLAAARRPDEDDELAVRRRRGRCLSAPRPCRRTLVLRARSSDAFETSPSALGSRLQRVLTSRHRRCAGRARFSSAARQTRERLHRVVHVAGEVDDPRGSPSARKPARGRRAPGGRARLPSTASRRAARTCRRRRSRRWCTRMRRGLGVRVDIVRLGALVHHDRHAAVRRHHVLHEEGGLRHHRPPAGLVPADRAVVEQHLQVAVIVHVGRDLVGQPQRPCRAPRPAWHR